jgi:hypothetical protein
MKKKLLLACLLATMVYANAQNVGIGTTTPLARLHVKDSSVLFSATGDAPFPPANPSISGAGRRMMWYPDKAAFRAGYVNANRWNKDSIGVYSIAMGYDTKASGVVSTAIGQETTASSDGATALGFRTTASASSSTAMGYQTTASGLSSTAMGHQTTAGGSSSIAMGYLAIAGGHYSTAMGYQTIAMGQYSTVLGYQTTASGISSTAMGGQTSATGQYSTATGAGSIASGDVSTATGYGTTAKALGSFSTGSLNDDSDNPSPGSSLPNDRIFQIGNGSNSGGRKNAVTVLRSGNTGIGTVNPGTRLHVFQGSSGYVGGNHPGITLEGNADVYVNILSPNSNETGLLFGKAADNSSGGIVYNNNAHLNGLEFRTNGNATRMVLDNNGNLGVGVTDPVFRLDVGDRMRLRSSGGNSAGLWLNNDINTTSPAFVGMKANDEVGFYGQTGTVGWRFYVNTTTGNAWIQGTLTYSSDARLKKDISRLQNPLQKIIQLNGYTYHWKDEQLDNSLQTGVLAQEVQKLFPHLVNENNDGMLSVNYSGLIPVMIESIKEQQRQIDELKKMVEKFIKQ